MPEKIDLSTWPRREAYEHFTARSNPFFNVTFPVDVTNLYRHAKAQGVSFYYALIYLSTQAVNQVEAFRYTLDGGQIFRLEKRRPSFTDLNPGSEQFHITTLPLEGPLEAFCKAAREKSRAQTAFLIPSSETKDLIYYSSLPWFDITSLTNERDFDPDDAIPRIAWGRYVEAHGRKKLHVSMELNHRFLDGLHVGRYYEALTALIEAL